MERSMSELSAKLSEEPNMRELCIVVAAPQPLEPQKIWFVRGARLASISFRQFKAIFRGEITDPEHKSVRRLREAAERKGKDEASQLARRFETLAETMHAADQDFYREDVAALLHAARALRGLDRTGTDRKQR